MIWEPYGEYPGIKVSWRNGIGAAKKWYRDNPDEFRTQMKEYFQQLDEIDEKAALGR